MRAVLLGLMEKGGANEGAIPELINSTTELTTADCILGEYSTAVIADVTRVLADSRSNLRSNGMMKNGIRRLFTGALLAVSTLLPVSTTWASPPTPQMFREDISFIDNSCGFPVATHVTLQYVNHYDASGQVTMNNWDVHWTYTNPANGVTLQVVTNGPNQYTYNADGSVTTTLMGVQVKVINKGLVSGLIGREVITVFPDPTTPPVISFLSGISTDPGPHSLPAACPVLAGQ